MLQLLTNTQAVLQDHLLQIVQATFQVLHPHTGALQTVRGAHVEHQHPVDSADQFLVGQIRGKQIRVARTHAAVAAYVQVPAVLGGDHADVLTLGFRTFAGAAGHRHLELMGGTQALVAVLQKNRHVHTVLHAVAAPGAADAGLHRTQGLAVGVAGFEAGGDEFFPDFGQFAQGGAEQVHPLTARDLGVQVVFLGHFTQHNQLVRGDFAARHPGNDGVSAVLLHVGHEGIVGVLQGHVVGGQDVLVPAGGKDGRDGRFADIAAMTLAVITDQCPEGADAIDLHDIEQVLAAVREVLTDVLADFHAAFFQFAVHHVFQQCRAATTAGAGLGFCLNTSKVGTAGIDHAADIALGHVVAGADRGGFRQGIRAQRGSTALVFRQNQGLRVLRQLNAVQRILQQGVVVAVVAHQDGAQQGLAICADHHAAVVAGLLIVKANVAGARRLGMGIADRADIHTQQLELGAHVGAGKGGLTVTIQHGGQGAGHGVARCHQAKNLLTPQRALANGVDVGVGGGALVVDDNATAFTHGQFAGTGQGVLGADAGGEHDQVGFQMGIVTEIHPQAGFFAFNDFSGGFLSMNLHPELFDFML